MTNNNSSDSYQKTGCLSKLDDLELKISRLQQEFNDFVEHTELQNADQNRRITALSYATGVLNESNVNFSTPDEWKDMLDEFEFSPTCVLMTESVRDTDTQLYNETIKRGFLTTSDVMHILSFSRPGAIRAMRRSAELHSDLVFAKRRTRNNSARRVWILEHVEHMSTVAVNGFGFA